MYEMTHDGFSFLCMGFTGPKAAHWKELYIKAFNAMKEELLRGKPAGQSRLSAALLREMRLADPRIAREFLAQHGFASAKLAPEPLARAGRGAPKASSRVAHAHGWDGEAVALPHFLKALAANLHRFTPIEAAALVQHTLGWRYECPERGAFWAVTSAGLAELAGPCELKRLLHELSWAGWLWHDADKLKHKAPCIASIGGGRPYLYFVSADALGGAGVAGEG
jgi:hypothetical protein